LQPLNERVKVDWHCGKGDERKAKKYLKIFGWLKKRVTFAAPK
jgi:hypothetical protein